jgi:hypothetical protein
VRNVATGTHSWYTVNINLHVNTLCLQVSNITLKQKILILLIIMQDHHVVKFLLGVCAECVPCLKGLSERSEFVREVISIVTGHTSIAIETILKQPYRLRSFVYTSLRHESDGDYGWGSVGDADCKEEPRGCIRTPIGCKDHVTQYIISMTGVSGNAATEVESLSCRSSGQDRSYDVRCRHLDKEELISWELATDHFLDTSKSMSAILSGADADDRFDDNCGGDMSLKREAAEKRKRLILRRRHRHCGLDVSIPSADAHRGLSEEGCVWSVLGVAMLAHSVLSSLYEPCHSGSVYIFPRVFSFRHLWNTFYPLILPLLRVQALSVHEGLKMITYLGKTEKHTTQHIALTPCSLLLSLIKDISLCQFGPKILSSDHCE